jgi:hypothetical protein
LTGIQRVGTVNSTFERGFDLGKSIESKYDEKKNKFLHQITFKVQVKFGNKGDNLSFASVLNGVETGSASIKFDQ